MPTTKEKRRFLFICTATTMVSGKQGIKEGLNMIIKNPKTVIPTVAAVLLVVIVGVISTFTGAKAVPLSAEEALEQLAASAYHTKNEVSFKIPEAYENPEEWNIHIAGLLEFEDGFSRSIHHLEDINDARAWKPGERYSIALNDGYTELTLTASLPDGSGSGGMLEKTVDLLNTPPFTVSYGLLHLGAGGKVLSAISPLPGDYARLAEDVVMNYLIRSTVWPEVDIRTLSECYLLRATYSDGTRTDYYVYLLDGKAVMQAGADGICSSIDDGLYEQLVMLAQQSSTATVGGMDGPTNVNITATKPGTGS